MPSWKFEGLDEYRDQLARLQYRALGVIKYALYPGAGVVLDTVKRFCPVSEGGGDLRDSAALRYMKKDGDYIYTEICFPGYDRKGVPNQLKANVLESGTSKRKKQPFIRMAFDACRLDAEGAIANAMDEKLKEIFND